MWCNVFATQLPFGAETIDPMTCLYKTRVDSHNNKMRQKWFSSPIIKK